jgi:hypothetical protein
MLACLQMAAVRHHACFDITPLLRLYLMYKLWNAGKCCTRAAGAQQLSAPAKRLGGQISDDLCMHRSTTAAVLRRCIGPFVQQLMT